jgi:tetratricopeptide (TPR) repeat protein
MGKSAVGMVDVDDKWNDFQETVKEYDQLITDLSFHTSNFHYSQSSDIPVAKMHDAQVKQHDVGFSQWLAPFNGLVKEQFLRVRNRCDRNTLEWAEELPEFQNWMSGDSAHRILWIRGPPGFGKSTLAGHYIHLLEKRYPKSVLYFFCVRGTHISLMKVRDMIRALACQLSGLDENVLSRLEILKAQNFELDETKTGIRLLFQQLLEVPLSNMKRDIYIIVDGLDEVDTETKDTHDRSKDGAELEIDIFIRALAEIATTRLLFLSRPDTKFSALSKHNSTIKTVGPSDNVNDIEKYVTDVLANSTRLQNFFDLEEVEPVSFFLRKANGIFLWVAISLKTLQRIEAHADFKRELESLSQASGDMEKLYRNVLERVDENSRKWIQRILKWVVTARRLLTMVELREILEHSLQDKLGDFQNFIEIRCGSMLQILTAEDECGSKVQLIHETFRSFLLDGKNCPTDYHIDGKNDASIASECLRYLSSHSVGANIYIAEFWWRHLQDACLRGIESDELSVQLHHFLTSEGPGLHSWIQDCFRTQRRSWAPGRFLTRDELRAWRSKSSEASATAIVHFKRWPWSWHSIPTRSGLTFRIARLPLFQEWLFPLDLWIRSLRAPFTRSFRFRKSTPTTRALNWFRSNVSHSWRLRQYVGRIVGSMWVHGDFPNLDEDRAFFYFALDLCLATRKSAEFFELSKVRTFYDTEAYQSWTTGDSQRKARNIGAGYFFLRQWDDCVKCFDAAPDTAEMSLEKWLFKGMAYQEKGDLVRSIEALTKAVGLDRKSNNSWIELGKAYGKKDDFFLSLDAFETAINIGVEIGERTKFGPPYQATDNSVQMNVTKQCLIFLQQASMTEIKCDRLMEVLNRLLDNENDGWFSMQLCRLWLCLGNAYRGCGHQDKSLQAYNKSVGISYQRY